MDPREFGIPVDRSPLDPPSLPRDSVSNPASFRDRADRAWKLMQDAYLADRRRQQEEDAQRRREHWDQLSLDRTHIEAV